jgi:hypothetical protein
MSCWDRQRKLVFAKEIVELFEIDSLGALHCPVQVVEFEFDLGVFEGWRRHLDVEVGLERGTVWRKISLEAGVQVTEEGYSNLRDFAAAFVGDIRPREKSVLSSGIRARS